MKTNEQIRIENKLKLWETPGFSQFIGDLAEYKTDSSLPNFVGVLKKLYQARLKELQDETGKFKQGKLKL